jgi:hypothetical protein
MTASVICRDPKRLDRRDAHKVCQSSMLTCAADAAVPLAPYQASCCCCSIGGREPRRRPKRRAELARLPRSNAARSVIPHEGLGRRAASCVELCTGCQQRHDGARRQAVIVSLSSTAFAAAWSSTCVAGRRNTTLATVIIRLALSTMSSSRACHPGNYV